MYKFVKNIDKNNCYIKRYMSGQSLKKWSLLDYIYIPYMHAGVDCVE